MRVFAFRKQPGGLFSAKSGEPGTEMPAFRSASHPYARRSRGSGGKSLPAYQKYQSNTCCSSIFMDTDRRKFLRSMELPYIM